ncbi:MAG: CoA transferase [Candidatus Tectomicrobia bacterium]|uniref:CoA transferase n=1 Tax=Tectimicrobiota bacterium TaxID=2528274 RepID=A0A938B2L7_UNCTE|nr:CoA transferase [Candidatus Tectomicrobia bacterium]
MAGALTGTTVLELSRVSPGSLCTRLLADMGAEVLKIETPPALGPNAGSGVSARTARQAAFSSLNRNKRSLGVNLKTPQGQVILQQLAERADVLVEGFRPGVMQRLHADYATLSQRNPRLVYCSLSGFGQNGPYRAMPAHDLNYLALSGVLNLIGAADRPPAIPLNIIADYGGAALHGVAGILLALYARHRTGRGQHVDIAYLDATISLLAATPLMANAFAESRMPQRGHGPYTGFYAFYTTYETQDGRYLSVGCSEPWLWDNLCRALGRPDLTPFYRRAEHLTRAPTAEEAQVRTQLQALFRERTLQEWLTYLADKNVCIGPVNTAAEVFADPHVQHRQMLYEQSTPAGDTVRQAGIALKLSDTPGSVRHLGPSLGQHTDAVLTELGYSAADTQALRAQGIVG